MMSTAMAWMRRKSTVRIDVRRRQCCCCCSWMKTALEVVRLYVVMETRPRVLEWLKVVA